LNLSKHLSRSQKTLIAVVSDHVQRHTGLDARKLCAGSVELAIRRRLARLGIEGLDRYTQLLLSEPPELRELVEELVVRETWFFRESETLDAVASLWRTWAREGLARRPFRVLSAPCSTGEEAYSVVMRLIEAGALQEQIAVEGLDISESALLQAKEGVYEQYSLRGVVPSRRERFFFKEGNSFRLRDDVLRSVRFRVGNLNLISDLAGLGPFDVILCRNLLIYMDHPARARVLGALGGLLSPAGWLFLGAAEAPRHAGRQFVTRGIGTVRAFQPRDEERADPAAPAPVQGLGESRAPVRAAPVEAPSDRKLSGRRVLVVEDHPISRKHIVSLLQKHGVEVVGSGSGGDALSRIIQGQAFDLIVLDQQLPDIGYAEWVNAMRKLPTAATTPVLMLSGERKRLDASEMQRLGIAAMVYKPARERSLLEAAHKGLGLLEAEHVVRSKTQFRNLAEQAPLRILVADDSSVNQKVTSAMLHRMGYRPRIVSNGEEVLLALESECFDLVLLDVQMPVMDGHEAARRIMRDYSGARRPYITALTANAMEGDRDACLAAGMDHFLSKPIRVRDLEEAILRCFAARQAGPESGRQAA